MITSLYILHTCYTFGTLQNVQAKRSSRQQTDGCRMGWLLGVFGQRGRCSGFPAEDEGLLLEEGTAAIHHRRCLVCHPTRCWGFSHCKLVIIRIPSSYLNIPDLLFQFCHQMLFFLFWFVLVLREHSIPFPCDNLVRALPSGIHRFCEPQASCTFQKIQQSQMN